MKNYEKLLSLIKDRDLAVSKIEEEYKPKFAEFDCAFSKEGIEGAGWKKVGFYAAAVEDIYEKNGKKIGVYRDYCRILVRDITQCWPIYDYEHLEDYSLGLVYSDVVFYYY